MFGIVALSGFTNESSNHLIIIFPFFINFQISQLVKKKSFGGTELKSLRSDDWPGRSNATKITPASKSLNSTSEKTHKQNHSYEVVTCTYRVSISNVCDIPFQCILDSTERLETPCKEADCLVESKGGNKRTR